MPLRRDGDTVGGPVDTSSSMPDNWSEFGTDHQVNARLDRSEYDPWIHHSIALSPFPALLQPLTGTKPPQLSSASA